MGRMQLRRRGDSQFDKSRLALSDHAVEVVRVKVDDIRREGPAQRDNYSKEGEGELHGVVATTYEVSEGKEEEEG